MTHDFISLMWFQEAHEKMIWAQNQTPRNRTNNFTGSDCDVTVLVESNMDTNSSAHVTSLVILLHVTVFCICVFFAFGFGDPSIHPFSSAYPGRVAGAAVWAGTPRLPSPRTLPPAPLGGSQDVPRPSDIVRLFPPQRGDIPCPHGQSHRLGIGSSGPRPPKSHRTCPFWWRRSGRCEHPCFHTRHRGHWVSWYEQKSCESESVVVVWLVSANLISLNCTHTVLNWVTLASRCFFFF